MDKSILKFEYFFKNTGTLLKIQVHAPLLITTIIIILALNPLSFLLAKKVNISVKNIKLEVARVPIERQDLLLRILVTRTE